MKQIPYTPREVFNNHETRAHTTHLANENPGGRVGFGIFGGCGGFLRGVRGLSPAAFGLSAAPGVGTVGRLSLSFGGMTGVGKPMLSGLSEDEESVKVTSINVQSSCSYDET